MCHIFREKIEYFIETTGKKRGKIQSIIIFFMSSRCLIFVQNADNVSTICKDYVAGGAVIQSLQGDKFL